MKKTTIGVYGLVPIDLLLDPWVTLNAIKVYTAISSFQGTNGSAWPSREAIAQRAGLGDVSKVSTATSLLEKNGWIKKKSRAFENKTTVYVVCFSTDPLTETATYPVTETVTTPVTETATSFLYEKNNRKEQLHNFVIVEDEKLPASEKRYQRLMKEYGEQTTHEYLRRVLAYCDSTGKKYKDYAAAAETFMRRDGVRKIMINNNESPISDMVVSKLYGGKDEQ